MKKFILILSIALFSINASQSQELTKQVINILEELGDLQLTEKICLYLLENNKLSLERRDTMDGSQSPGLPNPYDGNTTITERLEANINGYDIATTSIIVVNTNQKKEEIWFEFMIKKNNVAVYFTPGGSIIKSTIWKGGAYPYTFCFLRYQKAKIQRPNEGGELLKNTTEIKRFFNTDLVNMIE